jgi:methyltransferase (TIGR00027 family)
MPLWSSATPGRTFEYYHCRRANKEDTVITGMTTELVRNVSDTARWVATYRARESVRPDALFHDPFADRLAGSRGRAIAAVASNHTAWAITTRTKLLDDLVTTSVAEGADCVLNLAAGFDTRPYRLSLPQSLRWVEADLPELIEEKQQLLARDSPRCQLESVGIDLADRNKLTEFLARYTAGAKNVTVITEGLVLYLEESVVKGFSADLAACPAIRHWVLDVNSPRVNADLRRSMGKTLSNAPFKFAPSNGLAFFEALGWQPREARSLFREGLRFKRIPLWMRPFALFPDPDPRALGNKPWSAVVRLERSPLVVAESSAAIAGRGP